MRKFMLVSILFVVFVSTGFAQNWYPPNGNTISKYEVWPDVIYVMLSGESTWYLMNSTSTSKSNDELQSVLNRALATIINAKNNGLKVRMFTASSGTTYPGFRGIDHQEQYN